MQCTTQNPIGPVLSSAALSDRGTEGIPPQPPHPSPTEPRTSLAHSRHAPRASCATTAQVSGAQQPQQHATRSTVAVFDRYDRAEAWHVVDQAGGTNIGDVRPLLPWRGRGLRGRVAAAVERPERQPESWGKGPQRERWRSRRVCCHPTLRRCGRTRER